MGKLKDFNLKEGLSREPIPFMPIRVTIPASVAYDLGRMEKVNKIVLGKLGCPNCHSGFAILYDIERVFEFNENLELIENFRR